MAKKYTFMIFSADRMGRVHTVTLSRKFISGIIASVFALILASGILVYHVHRFYQEKNMVLAYSDENSALKAQLSLYTAQINSITHKISELDNLAYKIRDLVTLQTGNTPLKPIAVGGKEVDLLREYASAAALNEKDFFSTLDSTLQELSYEVSNRELNLSELVSSLEEQRLIMLYTPTLWPVKGWISSEFGYRISPFSAKQVFHEGIDIASRYGADVKASAKGIVVFAGTKPGYGQMVAIDHGYGYISRYGHNSIINVKVGDRVEKGAAIAKVGSTGQSTGPHVHYEVLVNGIPVDPLKFIIEDEI